MTYLAETTATCPFRHPMGDFANNTHNFSLHRKKTAAAGLPAHNTLPPDIRKSGAGSCYQRCLTRLRVGRRFAKPKAQPPSRCVYNLLVFLANTLVSTPKQHLTGKRCMRADWDEFRMGSTVCSRY